MATITENWMSTVDSPTYKFTMYVVAPTVWNDPTEKLLNDTAALNNGEAVIIAETGATAGYSIENMLMLSKVTPGISSGNTTTGTFQFDIYEPLGFKLLDRILKLGRAFNFTTMASAKYVMKLEFQARDPVTSKPIKYPGVFFYPMMINQIQASVSAEGARYNIVASNIMRAALYNSSVNTDIKLEQINSVDSFINELSSKLNKYELDLRKTKTSDAPAVRKKWKIVFDSSATLGSSSNINADSFNLKNQAFAGTADSARAGGQSANKDNPDTRDIIINANTNIVSYITDRLTKNVPGFAQYAKKYRDSGEKVPYIVVTPTIEYGNGIDPATNTSEETIVLTIAINWTYTNVSRDPAKQQNNLNSNSFQKSRFNKLPVVKKYNFLYSGLTTEVMDFDLKFEQLFFVARDPAGGFSYNEANETFVPTNPEKVTSGSEEEYIKLDLINLPTQKFSPYLSDIDTDPAKGIELPQYAYANLNSDKQQVNETKGKVETIDAIRDRETAVREVDYMNVDFRVKGDPFWMGTPGGYVSGAVDSLVSYLDTDSLIAFINYLPDEAIASTTNQHRGELDIVSSGIYRIIEVESKFQQGQFTQQLSGYRDRNTSTYLVRDQLEKLEIGDPVNAGNKPRDDGPRGIRVELFTSD
jgi:hypothetical protein